MAFEWALVKDGNVTAKERDDWEAHRKTENINDSQFSMLLHQNLDKVARAISLVSENCNCTCGGSIPLSDLDPKDAAPEVQGRDLGPFRIVGRPIVLRTDAMGPIQSFKIHFPPQPENWISMQLLASCLSSQLPSRLTINPDDLRTIMEPVHLTADKFSVDFHPAEYGIVDSISKALLPTFRNGIILKDSLQDSHFGVEAKLLKMSIYEATPQWVEFSDENYGSPAQTEFGFLVVCLPYPHTGGMMQQEYQGVNRAIDWSSKEGKSIRWVAFSNKVKNHVFNIETGLKVTLTYRLNVTFGGISKSPEIYNSLAAGYFPFHGAFKSILKDANCLVDGGTIGYFCVHQYQHADGNMGNDRFPADLMGLDLAVYSVFNARELGAKNVRVNFVLEDLQNHCTKEKKGTGPICYTCCKGSRDLDGKAIELVGTCHRLTDKLIGSIKFANSRCNSLIKLLDRLGHTSGLSDIHWLNRPNHAVNTFGYSNIQSVPSILNDSDVKWIKSYLAIFVQIPTFEERSKIITLGIEKDQRGTKRKAEE